MSQLGSSDEDDSDNSDEECRLSEFYLVYIFTLLRALLTVLYKFIQINNYIRIVH